MANYGNDPTFSSYITTVNTAPQEVVALAQASERAGLDLVAMPISCVPSRLMMTEECQGHRFTVCAFPRS